MDTAALRRAFLDFFEAHGHRRVDSAALVPQRDPSLLFTNSGMVQFKDYFLGRAAPPAPCLVTAQRCLRAGGKHNDLDNVGYTSRHHTFFEMLGNFSFGDYFKQRAIELAWQFLTDADKGLGLDRRHLWVTVYGGGHPFAIDPEREEFRGDEIKPDEEAQSIWLQLLQDAGFSEAEAERRVVPVPSNDNFWMMGDTGPCGPCSEIFYDRDAETSAFRGREEAHADDCVELWNLVFMQYQRDDSRAVGALPQPCVDTGMGLERIAAVTQGVAGNYDIDLFSSLMAAVDEVVVAAGGERAEGSFGAAHRVVADHLRAAVGLVGDGVLPDNSGRGYVLRRILRRAVRHAHQLGASEPVLADLVPAALHEMTPAWPELTARAGAIAAVLRREEQLFARTLEQGLAVFEEQVVGLRHGDELTGEKIFFLHDTFGFPRELTRDLAAERGLRFDEKGFDLALINQRRHSAGRPPLDRHGGVGESLLQEGGHRVGASPPEVPIPPLLIPAQGLPFCGDTVDLTHGEQQQQFGLLLFIPDEPSEFSPDVMGFDPDLLARDRHVQLSGDESCWLLLDRNRFYAEGGGQVGDTGRLQLVGNNDGQDTGGARLAVLDTQKLEMWPDDHARNDEGSLLCTFLKVRPVDGGTVQLKKDDKFRFILDLDRRRAITANHSATHLLHAALRRVLGEHVRQRGSLVNAQMTRFDFSHPEPLSESQWTAIERLVREQIDKKLPVEIAQLSREEADRAGAMALFGEQYGKQVRVLSMGAEDDSGRPFSVELCGGTHVRNTGDIEDFCLISESGVAAGVRRVVGKGGAAAAAHRRESGELLQRLADCLRVAAAADAPPIAVLESQLAALQADLRALERHCELLRARLAQGGGEAPPPPAASAVPPPAAVLDDDDESALLRRLGRALKAPREGLPAKLEQLTERRLALRAEAATLRERLAQSGGDGADAVVCVANTAVLALRVEASDARALREAVDHYRDRTGGVVFLAAERDGRLLLAAGVAKPLLSRLSAGELLREFAGRLGGKGGGRADFAQGGGSDLAALPATLAAVPSWVEQRLLADPGTT